MIGFVPINKKLKINKPTKNKLNKGKNIANKTGKQSLQQPSNGNKREHNTSHTIQRTQYVNGGVPYLGTNHAARNSY